MYQIVNFGSLSTTFKAIVVSEVDGTIAKIVLSLKPNHYDQVTLVKISDPHLYL
jgi:hypothetical protein